MQRDDFLSLEINRLDGRHADVLETFQMRQVTLAEGHEKADALDAGDVQRQRLDFLMMQEVHILRADLIEVVHALDFHRLRIDPLAVLPIAALGRDLADIDLRVEIRGERIAVVAAVAVEDVDIIDFVKLMLQRISRENARHARIEARAEKRRDARVLEAVAVRPLPFVLEMRGIGRLVVRRVHIIRLRGEAGVHDGKVLIRKREIQHHVRLLTLDQRDQLVDVVRVHLRRRDLRLSAVQLRLQSVALRLRTAGDADRVKRLAVLTAFMYGDARNAARADNQSLSHDDSPLCISMLCIVLQ